MAAEFLGVPEWWLPVVRNFLARVVPASRGLAVTVTSWQRTAGHNREVGGAEESQHLLATAIDVSGPDQDVYASRARAAGLVVIDEGDHVHVQLVQAGLIPRWVYDQVTYI